MFVDRYLLRKLFSRSKKNSDSLQLS